MAVGMKRLLPILATATALLLWHEWSELAPLPAGPGGHQPGRALASDAGPTGPAPSRALAAEERDLAGRAPIREATRRAVRLSAIERGSLRTVLGVSARIDEVELEATKRGEHAADASTHVGRLFWLARGTRRDVAIAVGRLARRQQTWSLCEDEALARVYAYLWWWSALGLWFVCDQEEVPFLRLSTEVDADHAGDRATTTRSTSGHHTELVGPGVSSMPLDHAAKLQGATSLSTAESEVVAISEAVFRSAAPLQSFFEQVVAEEGSLESSGDSSEARKPPLEDSWKRLGSFKASGN